MSRYWVAHETPASFVQIIGPVKLECEEAKFFCSPVLSTCTQAHLARDAGVGCGGTTDRSRIFAISPPRPVEPIREPSSLSCYQRRHHIIPRRLVDKPNRKVRLWGRLGTLVTITRRHLGISSFQRRRDRGSWYVVGGSPRERRRN